MRGLAEAAPLRVARGRWEILQPPSTRASAARPASVRVASSSRAEPDNLKQLEQLLKEPGW